ICLRLRYGRVRRARKTPTTFLEASPVEERRSNSEALKVASLLYHDVVQKGRYETSGFQGAGPDRYKLEAAEFEAHLGALEEQIGDPAATVEELGRGNTRLPWLLTF